MYTMKDFELDLFKKYFPKLTPQEREEVLRTVPPAERLAGLTPQEKEEVLRELLSEARRAGQSEEQIRQYLDQLAATNRKPPSRKPRRKKK